MIMHPVLRVLWIVAASILPVCAAYAQPAVTVPAPAPPWTSFQAQQTPTIIFTFTRNPGATATQFLITTPAAGTTYTITKNGAACPVANPGGCGGSDVSPPVGVSGNFEIIGVGEPAGVATFVVTATAPSSGNWQVNPATNASFTQVRAIPDVVADFPAENASGAAGIKVDASASHTVIQPVPPPALTSVTFTQTAGPTVALATSGPLNAIATFNAPTVTAATDLIFQVVANDGTLSSTELVTITVAPPALPVDAVLAVDTSGSMGWHRTGVDLKGGCCSRLMSAKWAARLFVERLGALASDSRAGVAIFPGEPSPSTVLAKRFTPAAGLATVAQFSSINTDIGGESKTCGLCTATPAPADAGAPAVNSIPVNWNGTPTSVGLTEARTMLNSAPGGVPRSKVILLVSDGAWNAGVDPASAAFLAPFVSDGIRIFTLGMGTPGADDVNHSSLQDISVGTGVGTALNPIGLEPFNLGEAATEPNLVPHFEKIMSAMVSLDFAVDPSSIIEPGQQKTHMVPVTEHDTAVSFTLSWESSRQNVLALVVESPSGEKFQPTTSPNGHQNVTVLKDVLSQPKNHGPWKLHVFSPPIKDIGTLTYSYSVMINSALKLRPVVDKDRYFTGSPMVFEARLTEVNRRRAGAEVKLEITRPDSGIGEFHARNTINADQFAQIPAVISDEPLTALQRKNIVLQNSKIFPPKLVPAPVVPLRDDGRAPDRQAGDGIYTGTYPGLNLQGLYKFKIVATGKTSGGHDYQRETEVNRFVLAALTVQLLLGSMSAGDVRLSPFMPDDLRKKLAVPTPRGATRRMVTLRPVDAGGHLLGPGYLDQFKFTATGAQILGGFDQLNGEYSVVFEYPEGTRPTTVITLDETFGGVTTPPIDVQTGGQSHKKVPWWVWVIIVVGTGIAIAIGAL
jgi:hypothetical protein